MKILSFVAVWCVCTDTWFSTKRSAGDRGVLTNMIYRRHAHHLVTTSRVVRIDFPHRNTSSRNKWQSTGDINCPTLQWFLLLQSSRDICSSCRAFVNKPLHWNQTFHFPLLKSPLASPNHLFCVSVELPLQMHKNWQYLKNRWINKDLTVERCPK